MKIVVDENMPMPGLFAEFGEVIPAGKSNNGGGSVRGGRAAGTLRDPGSTKRCCWRPAPGWAFVGTSPYRHGTTSIRSRGGAGHSFFSAPAATKVSVRRLCAFGPAGGWPKGATS